MAGHAVINLGNSIIGVSILAIPFCFKECGLLLGGLLLLLGSSLNKQSCHLLLRASKATRRNSYELLAYHTLGGFGKLAVELSIICLLMSCCVAYFIIMGDLGPAIISKWLGLENDGRLRAGFLIFLAMFFILPLSQRRNLESISSISVISIVFYMLFTADLIFDCLPTLIAGDWIDAVAYWKPSGVFRGVSIFSAAFSCQTVLFAVYDTLQERTVKLMEDVVNRAITFVCSVYMSVGFFGYVLYNGGEGPKGDILLNFQPSFMSEVLRLGFAISVALSFPLVVFPCRASIYTLFFSSSHSLENPHGGSTGGSDYIPPGKFRSITLLIVLSTLVLGITIPNVEVILGFTGSTMGNLICFVFPSLICLRASGVPGRNTAKLLLVIGLFLMTASTYDNIQKAISQSTGIQSYPDKQAHHPVNQMEEDMAVLEARIANGNKKNGLQEKLDQMEETIEESKKVIDALEHPVLDEKDGRGKEGLQVKSNERHEPVVPDPPEEEKKVKSGVKDVDIEKKVEKETREREKNSKEEGKEDGGKIIEGVKEKEEDGVEEKEQDGHDKVEEDLKREADAANDDVVEVEKREDDVILEQEEKKKKKEEQEKDNTGDDKRHKKEHKEILKQSKKIKELEEMQQKQAEVIEHQANALEFLLQKQKEDELQAVMQQQPAVGGEQQPLIPQQGVIQPQQGIVQAQQQPVIQPQQQAIVQQQAAQQPMLQQQQQQMIQQQQQQMIQQQQPVLQEQQQPMRQQQQPMLQQQQQPMIQQPVLQQQQQAVVQQQQPMLQQQAVVQQQPVLQQQQQGFVNQQPVLQPAGGPVQQQQLPVVDQGGVPLAVGFQQEVGIQPGLQQADLVGQGAVPVGQQNVAVQNAQQQLWQDPQQVQQQMMQQQQLVGAGLQNLAAVQQQPLQVQEQQFVQQKPQIVGAGLQNVAVVQPAAEQQQVAVQQQDQQLLIQDPEQPAANEIRLDIKRDVGNMNFQENNNVVDQGLQGLPKELNFENRDIQGFAANKRVLQSHGYEGDEADKGEDEDTVEEAEVGAGEGEKDEGEKDEEQAEQNVEEEEEENVNEVDPDEDPAVGDEDIVEEEGKGEKELNASPGKETEKELEKKDVEAEKKNKFNRDILAVDVTNTTKKKDEKGE